MSLRSLRCISLCYSLLQCSLLQSLLLRNALLGQPLLLPLSSNLSLQLFLVPTKHFSRHWHLNMEKSHMGSKGV